MEQPLSSLLPRIAFPVLLVLLAGCDEDGAHGFPPAEAPAARIETGKVVWHDLVTPDLDGSTTFYASLFGWEMTGGSRHRIARNDGEPVAVLFRNEEASRLGTPAAWVTYFATLDVTATGKRIEDSGGVILRGPMPMEGRGFTVIGKDPSGAVFGLVEAAPSPASGPNTWVWAELAYDDRDVVLSFYNEILGLENTPNKNSPDAQVLLADGTPVAGAMTSPFEKVTGIWTPFVEVDDVGQAAARAVDLGGRLVIAPDPSIRGGTVALIQDPQGGLFAIQQLPDDEE